MNWKFWIKSKPEITWHGVDVAPFISLTQMINGKLTCTHQNKSASTSTAQLTQPPNDGVYQGDGSPPIGTYKWRKPLGSDGKMHITFAVAIPANGTLVNIPNSHNLLIAIKAAFTTIEITSMLKFDQVPYTGPDCADITIGFDSGTDPLFVQFPQALARTHFPGTKPSGQITSLYNLKFALDLQNVNFHYDANEILRHELRHGIGDVHTTNTSDMMYPIYIERRRPSAMDIYQEQFNYGPRIPPLNPIEIEGFYSLDARNLEFVL